MMTIAHKQGVIFTRFTIGQGHHPAIARQRARRINAHIKGDCIAKLEMVDIVMEVLKELRVMGEIRPIVWHRKILKGEAIFRGVDMQALIT